MLASHTALTYVIKIPLLTTRYALRSLRSSLATLFTRRRLRKACATPVPPKLLSPLRVFAVEKEKSGGYLVRARWGPKPAKNGDDPLAKYREKVRVCEERIDELRRRVYGISTYEPARSEATMLPTQRSRSFLLLASLVAVAFSSQLPAAVLGKVSKEGTEMTLRTPQAPVLCAGFGGGIALGVAKKVRACEKRKAGEAQRTKRCENPGDSLSSSLTPASFARCSYSSGGMKATTSRRRVVEVALMPPRFSTCRTRAPKRRGCFWSVPPCVMASSPSASSTNSGNALESWPTLSREGSDATPRRLSRNAGR